LPAGHHESIFRKKRLKKMKVHSHFNSAVHGNKRDEIDDIHGIKMLAVSMIQLAVRDLESIKWKENARVWIDSDGVWPFSFDWCCQVLDTEPGYIRRKIKENAKKGKYINEQGKRGKKTKKEI
jgi:hypothetical protein